MANSNAQIMHMSISRKALLILLFIVSIIAFANDLFLKLSYFVFIIAGLIFIMLLLNLTDTRHVYKRSLKDFQGIQAFNYKKIFIPYQNILVFSLPIVSSFMFPTFPLSLIISTIGILLILVVDILIKNNISFYKIGIIGNNVCLCEEIFLKFSLETVNEISLNGFLDKLLFKSNNKTMFSFKLSKLNSTDRKLFINKIIDLAKKNNIKLSPNVISQTNAI